jgi:hypothetical protein
MYCTLITTYKPFSATNVALSQYADHSYYDIPLSQSLAMRAKERLLMIPVSLMSVY